MIEARATRKTLTGLVTSAKAAKTLTVRVEWMAKHPVFGKYVKHRTVIYAHDEERKAGEGDTVELAETRPLSKTKRWRLVRVVRSKPA